MHIRLKKQLPWYQRIWGPSAQGTPSLLGDIEDALCDLLTFPLRVAAHVLATGAFTLLFYLMIGIATLSLWLRPR